MQGLLVIGGRTNRLASAPRDSTALRSRPRESTRKGVEEPSLAGFYDINMMHHVLHLSLRCHCDRRLGLRESYRAANILLMSAPLWAFQRLGVR